jgi:hypothetical protein
MYRPDHSIDCYQGRFQVQRQNEATHHPVSILSEGVTEMMQKLFESSENLAVAYGVLLFIVFHFGMLFLFELV